MNPRYSDPIPDLQLLYRCAFFDHHPGDLVAGDQWCLNDFRELRPVSIDEVHIGMANTAGFNPYQDFAGCNPRLGNFFYREWLLEFAQNGGLHAFRLTFQGNDNSECGSECQG
jgi:hypothetical protein